MATILVVDDDKNLRALLDQELTDEGFTIATAPDGNAALEYLEEHRPDIVVLDISMPGMDGLEVLSRISGRDKSLPVILHSAYSTYRDNIYSMPANAYVVKSGDLSELIEKIKALLLERSALSVSGENI